MADNQKDVFKVLSDLEKRVLGINDDPKLVKPTPTGFIVSFLPTALTITKENYENPWSPGINDDDQQLTTKRQDSLVNLCELVDKKLMLDGSGQSVPSSTKISETWRIIVEGANALPSAMKEATEITKAVDEANKLLFVIDAEGNIVDDSPAYKKYQECSDTYDNALTTLSNEYNKAYDDKRKFQQWPITGKPFKNAVYTALDKWNSVGERSKIESAISFLSAQGIDVAAKLISLSKKRLEDNKIVLANNEYFYTRVRPSDWCDPENVEGWTEYTYSKSIQNDVETTSSRKWSGSAGFWLWKASASSSKETSSLISSTESLKITFNYALISIDRLFMTTLLPNLSGWFLKGGKKGCISTGKPVQEIPSDETGWLPAIPTTMIAVKNVTITSDEIKKNIEEIKTAFSGSGGGGWGIFSGRGSYSKADGSKKTGIEVTNEGIVIHGTQVIGWISEILPECPKVTDPALGS